MKTKIYLLLWALALVACSEDDLKEILDEQGAITEDVVINLEDFSATIVENPTMGQVLGTIVGTTTEGTITFSIVSQSPEGAIGLNSTSGELTVADSARFDFEFVTSITAKVVGTSGAVKDTVDVTITITDLVEILSIQDRLDGGETPLEIYESDNELLDELYGKSYAGGLIFYFDENTGAGKVAAPTDQSASTTWGCNSSNLGMTIDEPGYPSIFICIAEGKELGDGSANTGEILDYCATAPAALICDDLIIDSYEDWYLPSIDELMAFLTKIPQEAGGGYWSSSQKCRDTGGSAAYAGYTDLTQLAILKSNSKRVRAIRDFEEPSSEARWNP